MKLSINVPTYNEKEYIKNFIKNVLKVADEIILIDDSTDETLKIAKKMSKKVKVIKYDVKDFSKIRNRGIKEVKKGWYIMYLDSDELLSQELINNIKKLKKEKELVDAYLIKRRNYFIYNDKSTACLTTRFIRGEPKIFKKGVIKFINKIHEKAVFKIKNPEVKELSGDTLHYPKTGRYKKYGKYSIMNVEETIEKRNFIKRILVLIKQLIKYILIFDYSSKYFKGNFKLWFKTLKGLFDFIDLYIKMKFFGKKYTY